ncbi:hypothetical protein OAD02_05815 [Alphaproteobacteria bacterium]|nr:hypothetical protein [Alphaproteobacteria bacterium]
MLIPKNHFSLIFVIFFIPIQTIFDSNIYVFITIWSITLGISFLLLALNINKAKKELVFFFYVPLLFCLVLLWLFWIFSGAHRETLSPTLIFTILVHFGLAQLILFSSVPLNLSCLARFVAVPFFLFILLNFALNQTIGIEMLSKGEQFGISIITLSILFVWSFREGKRQIYFICCGIIIVLLSLSLKITIFFLVLNFGLILNSSFLYLIIISIFSFIIYFIDGIPVPYDILNTLGVNDLNLLDSFSHLVIIRLQEIIFSNQESLYAVNDVAANLNLKIKVLSLINQPLIGKGLEYERLLIGTSAHNSYISMLMGGGLFGLCFFLVPVVWIWCQILFKRYLPFRKEALWLMVAILILGNAAPIYGTLPFFIVFLLPFILVRFRA